MATDVAEPVSAEQVDTIEAPTVGKRGRRKTEDDPRNVFTVPDNMLNEKGKIKVWDHDCGYLWGGDDDCHQPIKKELFATNEVNIDYRISGKKAKIEVIQEEINLLVQQRERTSGIDNVVHREKANKAIKAHTQLLKLMKELKAQNIDMDAVLSLALPSD